MNICQAKCEEKFEVPTEGLRREDFKKDREKECGEFIRYIKEEIGKLLNYEGCIIYQ